MSLSSNSTSENETTLNGTSDGNVTNYNGYYYCKYDSEMSSTYGVVGFVFLCITQVVIMGCTKCLCFDGEHKPGGMRACAVVSFGLLWYLFIAPTLLFQFKKKLVTQYEQVMIIFCITHTPKKFFIYKYKFVTLSLIKQTLTFDTILVWIRSTWFIMYSQTLF